MLNIKLYDDNFKLNKQDLISFSLEKALSVECKAIITIENKTFYDDWICPLEFYYQYIKWNKRLIKENCSFHYITEDNELNPILEFFYDSKNKVWMIDSCLKKYNENIRFGKIEIIDFFKNFEKQLLLHIE